MPTQYGGIVIGETSIDLEETAPEAALVLARLLEAFDFSLAHSDIVELDERNVPVVPVFTEFRISEELPGGWVATFPSGTTIVAEIVDWGFVPIPGSTPERCVQRYKVLYRQIS